MNTQTARTVTITFIESGPGRKTVCVDGVAVCHIEVSGIGYGVWRDNPCDGRYFDTEAEADDFALNNFTPLRGAIEHEVL